MTKDDRKTLAEFMAEVKADPCEANCLVFADWLEERGQSEPAEHLRRGDSHSAFVVLIQHFVKERANQMNPSILFTDLFPDGFWVRNDWFESRRNLMMTCRCDVRIVGQFLADETPSNAFQAVPLTNYDFRAYPPEGKGALYTTICVGQCFRCKRVFWGSKDGDLLTIIKMCEIAKEFPDGIFRRVTQYPWPG